MDRTSKTSRRKKFIQNFYLNVQENRKLRRQKRVNGRILKLTLEKYGVKMLIELNWIRLWFSHVDSNELRVAKGQWISYPA